MGKKAPKVVKKGKKARTGRKHKSDPAYKFYQIKDGKLERTKKNCPRCGAGTFLSMHKNRSYCGKCNYTALMKKEAPQAPVAK